jgi:hypothetical protein
MQVSQSSRLPREVYEETGLTVAIIGLIGVCSRPFWTRHGAYNVIVAALPQSQTLTPQAAEVMAIDYFPHHQLPEAMLWDHPTYIQAAFARTWGQVWTSSVRMPAELMDRAALYQWRDHLGVPRQQAYELLLNRIGPCMLTNAFPHTS